VFIGHFALGFAAKRIEPRGSLALYFAAAQWPDVIWPVLLLTGTEHVTVAPGDTAFNPLRFDSYPISHSLVLDAVWGLLFAGVVWLATRNRRAAWVSGALVLSHWVLDFASHRPDMPLAPGSGARFGLGLWNSVAATIVTELALLAIGVWMYVRATQRRDAIGSYGLAGLIALLLLAYFGAAFGTPPPDTLILAVTAILGALIALGASLWVDRHRRAV
jgi:hypothetical protein